MYQKEIPAIIVSRLPLYLQILKRVQQRGHLKVSSNELGHMLGISAAQIRKDLSQFGGFGKQGTGYNIIYLVEQLESILKVDRLWDVILVGIGDLGNALIRYQGFEPNGFRIVMAFDNDPAKIGKKTGSLYIQDTARLKKTLLGGSIKIGMLTVPASAAQVTAEKMVDAGIGAILNYAPVPLSLPDHIQVQYVDPVVRLQRMTYFME
jgi:redox-sensing transcriptional repressor